MEIVMAFRNHQMKMLVAYTQTLSFSCIYIQYLNNGSVPFTDAFG